MKRENSVGGTPRSLDPRGCEKTEQPQFHPEREAASRLRLAVGTLQNMRVQGTGPAFHKFGGRVLYSGADLDSWAASRRRTSTSDCGKAVAS